MAEFPVLPLFTDAYLGDTHHLSTIEHGAYLLLLISAWRRPGCCLPADDVSLARIARLTLGQWRRIKPNIAPFFNVTDGTWTQSRLTDEYTHVKRVRERQAAGGRVSVLKRKGRHSGKHGAYHEDTLLSGTSSPGTPSPSPSPQEEDIEGFTNTIRARDDVEWPADLIELTQALCSAGGIPHNRPGSIMRDQEIVRAWLSDGISVPETIVPTIRDKVASASDGISSMRFYDSHVRTAHARKLASEGKANDPSPRDPSEFVNAGAGAAARRLRQLRAERGDDGDGIELPAGAGTG